MVMTMAMLEPDSAAILSLAPQDAPQAAQGGKGSNYEAVRFNALQYGILSRHTVLAPGDAGEYRGLLGLIHEDYVKAIEVLRDPETFK